MRRLVALPAVTQREQARVTYRLHADRTSFTGVDLRRIVGRDQGRGTWATSGYS